jgi:transmembrane sensor
MNNSMAEERDPFDLAGLLVKYLKGELSHSENERLRKWVDADFRNRMLLEDLENQDALFKDLRFLSTVDKKAGWANLENRINEVPVRTKSLTTGVWKYLVAMLVFGILTYAMVLATYKYKRSGIIEARSATGNNDIPPGGDRGTLTLANGTVMVLEEIKNGTITEENGIRISRKDGEIVYEVIQSKVADEVSYNTIRTPVGGKFHIVLPDGSKVWLNSESSLHFPTVFSGSERKVDLVGEGYFEIEANRQMPFIVQAARTRVEVLGTHFNLMAYVDEGNAKTTLLEGSVKVSNGESFRKLVPGQQALIGEKIHVENVDVDEAVAWKNGYFQFEGESLVGIMNQLRRWYGIELADERLLPNKHFTAVISRNSSLSQVLKMLEMSGDLKFKIEGNTVSIE